MKNQAAEIAKYLDGRFAREGVAVDREQLVQLAKIVARQHLVLYALIRRNCFMDEYIHACRVNATRTQG